MDTEFWLSAAQFERLRPLLPNKPRGKPRVDDRRVISGIVHVLKYGGRWADAPKVYGPRKTLYNRWVRWAKAGVWRGVFEALAAAGGLSAELMLDSTHAKAHRCAAGGEGGAHAQAIGRSRGGRTTKVHALVDGRGRAVALEITPGQLGDAHAAVALIVQAPPSLSLAADTAYDSNGIRQFLIERGTIPVIPNNPTRKHLHPFDPNAYKRRNLVERAFSRLKDFRRVHTRYDKLAVTYDAAACLAASIIRWL